MRSRLDSSFRGSAIAAAVPLAIMLAGVGCYDPVFPEQPDAGTPPTDAASSDYEVELAVDPEHGHPGDVLTFTFTVTDAGQPVDGLEPDASFEQTEGGSASGEMAVSEGSAAGTYVARRAMNAGTYDIHFAFEVEGQHVERRFPFEIEGH